MIIHDPQVSLDDIYKSTSESIYRNVPEVQQVKISVDVFYEEQEIIFDSKISGEYRLKFGDKVCSQTLIVSDYKEGETLECLKSIGLPNPKVTKLESGAIQVRIQKTIDGTYDLLEVINLSMTSGEWNVDRTQLSSKPLAGTFR